MQWASPPLPSADRTSARRDFRTPRSAGSGSEDRLGDQDRLPDLDDVVHAKDLGARPHRHHVAGDRAAHAIADIPPGDGPDEPLARGADDDRTPKLAQLTEPVQQLEIVADGLPESNPWGDPDPALRHALAGRELDPRGQEGLDVVHDVAVHRVRLHR